MFGLCWTDDAVAQYARLKDKAEAAIARRPKNGRQKSTRDESLFKQVHKCVSLLAKNPRRPGLHTRGFRSLPHPLVPGEKVFEAYAQNRTAGAYRIFWCCGPAPGEITILAITPHP